MANCLTRALDQWEENPDEYRLWYNSNHVISLEGAYEGYDLTALKNSSLFMDYLPLRDYGYEQLSRSFPLTQEYQDLLKQYLKQEYI